MYAQIIDDTVGKTLVSASTVQKEVKSELEKTNDVAAAAYLGTIIAKRALENGINQFLFCILFSLANCFWNFSCFSKSCTYMTISISNFG